MTTVDRLKVSAIVLGGGRSRRFGRDKLSVPIDGVPLLHHAIEAVASVSDEVLVAGAADGPATSLPDESGVPIRMIRDAEPDQGPLVALLAAARVARGGIVIIVGGDMPELQPALLRRLLTWDPGFDGVCLDLDGWVQPLPVALDRERAVANGDVLLAGGERRLRRLITSLHMDVLAEHEWRRTDPDGRSLRDIDTPADLDRPA